MYVGLLMAAIAKEPRIEGVFQVFKRKRYGSGGGTGRRSEIAARVVSLKEDGSRNPFFAGAKMHAFNNYPK